MTCFNSHEKTEKVVPVAGATFSRLLQTLFQTQSLADRRVSAHAPDF
jgi:hypothetical protein